MFFLIFGNMQLTALRHRNERRPCKSYAYMSSCLLTLRRPEYRPPKQERKLGDRTLSHVVTLWRHFNSFPYFPYGPPRTSTKTYIHSTINTHCFTKQPSCACSITYSEKQSKQRFYHTESL